MTDKQIIIDGVNVSELTSEQLACMNRYGVAHLFIKLVEALSRTEDDYNIAQEDRVKMWTDNTELAEQLKRKEQECERLRDTYKKRLKIFCDMYNQLKAENEELKNFHINLVGVKECEIKELIKYKQTLKEIKEIAITEDINDECEYTLFGSCAMKAKKQILQKISECEVLDERI